MNLEEIRRPRMIRQLLSDALEARGMVWGARNEELRLREFDYAQGSPALKRWGAPPAGAQSAVPRAQALPQQDWLP